jgi:hypothetical protein
MSRGKRVILSLALLTFAASIAGALALPVNLVPDCPAEVWCEYSYRDANREIRALLILVAPVIAGALTVVGYGLEAPGRVREWYQAMTAWIGDHLFGAAVIGGALGGYVTVVIAWGLLFQPRGAAIRYGLASGIGVLVALLLIGCVLGGGARAK